MPEPYCSLCGRFLNQFEFEHLEHWCESCLSKHRQRLANWMMESEEYFEAAANDLDSFIVAMENGGQTECSVESMSGLCDPDGVYECLAMLIPDELNVISTCSTSDEAL